MKRIAWLALFLFFGYSTQAQEGNPALHFQLNHYLEATQSKDWSRILDMVNPKIFQLAPREMMEKMYSQLEKDGGIQFTISDLQVLDIKKSFTLSDTSYIPVDYSLVMSIQVNPEFYKTDNDLEILYRSFQHVYAGQEIYFDREKYTFTIHMKNTLVASSDTSTDQWYFSEYKANDPLVAYILPQEVRNKLQTGWN